MKFKVFEKGMLVSGSAIWAVIDGMGTQKYIGIQILEEEGLEEAINNKENWFLQEKWLNSFEKIEKSIGYEALFRIGTRIPFNAIMPIKIVDISSALNAIDIAYHTNHKNAAGQILYDPERESNERMLEGIGHFEVKSIDEKSRIAYMKCENPYPCDFDMGIITSFCLIGGKKAFIEHKDYEICRKNNNDYCLYKITWE